MIFFENLWARLAVHFFTLYIGVILNAVPFFLSKEVPVSLKMQLKEMKISAVDIFYPYNVHLDYLNAVEREENTYLIVSVLSAAFG